MTIVQALPQIITAVINALVNNIPKIIETGVKLLTALITNLPQIIAEIVRAMPQIITGIVSALGEGVSQVAEVGANLVRGLWQGIQSLAGWLWDKVSGWISSIWDGITDFFGIHSPSTKMAWVSEMNVEGAVVGIEKNKSKAVKAYGAMGEEMLAEVDSGLAAVNDKLKKLYRGNRNGLFHKGDRRGRLRIRPGGLDRARRRCDDLRRRRYKRRKSFSYRGARRP